jgi:hypothetical protein
MLAGIDEGLPYSIDPLPLTTEGELIAALQGRWTYAWYMGHATYRSEGRITRRPRPAVLAKHQCGQGLIAYIETARADQMARVISLLRQCNQPLEDDTEQRALITISDLLNGRVFAQSDKGVPF